MHLPDVCDVCRIDKNVELSLCVIDLFAHLFLVAAALSYSSLDATAAAAGHVRATGSTTEPIMTAGAHVMCVYRFFSSTAPH